jgi:hypothetical protein
MRQVTVTIRGLSPYSQSRKHDTPLLDKESRDAWEQRTWREKTTTDADGLLVIPAMAFKQALPVAAKRLGLQIPGRGKSTYTNFFKADVICTADAPLGIHKDAVPSITISANADGVRGSGKRVNRTFPQIPEWATTAHFMIFDDTITQAVFEQVFRAAGMSVGVGRFRPENGGLNGRFEPVKFEWAA